MENKLSFVIPEADLHFRLIRLLIILDNLSFTSKGNPILTIEKIVMFEFLVRHPNILKDVLKVISSKGNEKFVLYDEEVGSIEALYPNEMSLYDFTSTKVLLKTLIKHKLVEVNVVKDIIFFLITKEGIEFLKNTEADHIKRMVEICKAMYPLRSTTTNELKKIIKPIIKGGKNG
ncbi:ABC-three component system middle component 4 [Neobacillus soli]|uniref:ABC-three component system middle component 4 n=1 Tax=Neobacillus soli TaxID=220688 RepID=UPI000826E961|nr:ABC-three component system middle component 4 [Neobacillus soli]